MNSKLMQSHKHGDCILPNIVKADFILIFMYIRPQIWSHKFSNEKEMPLLKEEVPQPDNIIALPEARQ